MRLARIYFAGKPLSSMKVDETAITQDDSGLLHAATVARYAYVQNRSVESLSFENFESWAVENDAEFIIDTEKEFRWLQRQIANDKFNPDRAAKLSTLLEKQDGDDDKYMKALLHFLGDGEANA